MCTSLPQDKCTSWNKIIRER